MEVTRQNILALINSGLKRKSLSVMALERESGVPKDTVRDFLRGKTQILRADKLQKIMRLLEPERKVNVVGYVGAHCEIFPLTDGGKDGSPLQVDCPVGVNPDTVVAVRVKGDVSPVFLDGWVIYYSEQRDLVIPAIRGGWQVPYGKTGKKAAARPGGKSADPLSDLFGKPCVVKLRDGRVMLKTLKQGQTPGRYNLISYNASDLKDKELEWAAKIIFIKTE